MNKIIRTFYFHRCSDAYYEYTFDFNADRYTWINTSIEHNSIWRSHIKSSNWYYHIGGYVCFTIKNYKII